mmetsp:Transcript_13204/g.25655  ORF Transcript_13204/g.25655 Transcript_13204/m.25655 type:complete len:86 (+) Transcript_13204:220-477(+)
MCPSDEEQMEERVQMVATTNSKDWRGGRCQHLKKVEECSHAEQKGHSAPMHKGQSQSPVKPITTERHGEEPVQNQRQWTSERPKG